MSFVHNFLVKTQQFDKLSKVLLRLAIALILIWIGGLKFVQYEAEGITPFVSNSPFMSFFYKHPEEYKAHKHPEGLYREADEQWHHANNTYGFSHGLGVLLVSMGLLLVLDFVSPVFGLLGALLVFIMGIGTLSFLITTPEVWVTHWEALGKQGEGQHGFPYLAGPGRLVLKDAIMWAGAWIVGIDSAKRVLHRYPSCCCRRRASEAEA